jgi:signal transduction histidine kinase/ligand-binding sensor domain-containing protein/DNA-binding response OmpR family regulator
MRGMCTMVFLAGLCTAAAQADIRFEEVYSINPLSHNNVTAIHQDRQGFLWIGTFNGLNRYDGYRFKVYKFTDMEGSQASTNRIAAIHEDRTGRLWIEAYDGNYLCFNPLTEEFHSVPREGGEAFQDRFTHYYESPDGMVCLSTDKSGVFFITGGSLEQEPLIRHLQNSPGEDPLLTSNHVNFVVQDRNGYFWIGTGNGLSRIHEDDLSLEHPRVLKYFMEEGEAEGKGNPFTRALVFNDRVWFANRENGLTWYDPSTERFRSFADFPEVERLTQTEIWALKAHGRDLWIGTGEGKLIRYNLDQEKFSVFAFSDPRSGSVIDEIYCDLHSQVWMLTEKFGITRFDPITQKFRYYWLSPENSQDLIDDERTKIFEDSDHEFWLAGQIIGVQHYNREEDRFTVFVNDPHDPSSLQSSVVECIMEDRDRNIWLGTNWFGKGLTRMISVDPAFHYVVPEAEPESKMQNVVRSIFIDSEGYIWAGTKSGQIYIYDGDLHPVEVIQKDASTHYSGYNVYSIVEDEKGYIWLCTKGAGIFVSDQSVREIVPRYDRLTFSNIRHDPENPNSLSSNNVYDIEIDELGRVWVATYGGGLNLVETGAGGKKIFHRYTTGNSSITSDNLRDLHLDRNGRLWLASTLGVNYIDVYRESGEPLNIRHILAGPEANTELTYNDIIMIMEDSEGHLWLASAGGGVNEIINPGGEDFEFRYFAEKDGLTDDYIVSLAEDIYGFIWIGTTSGLSRYNPVNRDIDNFDKKAGLPEVSFSERTATAAASGKLLFGTFKGFYDISPDLIRTPDIHPSICLTGLQLNNMEVRPGDPGSPLNRSLSFAKELTLKSRQSNFSIEFSLLSFTSPESNHYSYKLEGFDEGWNYIGTQHKATFTNVPPGNYTFRVKGLDSDLSEYGTESTLKITILPPIWRTGMAFAVYVAFLLGLVLLAYRIIVRIMHLKSNLKVEKMVAESKLRFFTNISHEIRTPLTLILGPVDKLVNQTNLRTDVRQQLSVIHRNTKRLLRMVNMILDFRKIQVEKINLRIQEIELIPFLYQIYESFEAQARQKHIQFNLVYDPEDEHLNVWGDIQKLDIVIFNLLSNAFKFTPEHRSISIIVSREQDPESIQILVRDTGIGISRDKLDHVFDRFFVSHMDASNEYQGTGIGLSLSQEYINLHRGEISVESTPGKGTDFRVRLLTGRAHFPEDVVIKEREAYSYSPKIMLPEDAEAPEDGTGEEGSGFHEKTHILVVEDDTEMCFYLQQILEKQYRVDVAKDGLEGWDKARKLGPDLIVTDVMMPGLNGIEMTERLKEDFSTCHIPVIMLTSKSTVEAQVEGLQTGAEAYVPKPFNTEVLLSYIKSLLDQRRKIRSIMESRVELKPDEVQVTPKDKEFIERVLALINENLSNPEFNVEKLASKVYISRTLFYKKIKGITGYQPVELIRMMRLKKAAQFIETGEFTVSEVAYMVGYNDIRYFSTSFKKQYGISPSQYQVS